MLWRTGLSHRDSPSSQQKDGLFKKKTMYLNAGVREYWIVDPDKERTTFYPYEEDAAPIIIPFNENIIVGIYGD